MSVIPDAVQGVIPNEVLLCGPPEKALRAVQSSPSGLSSAEAQARISRYGANDVAKRKRRPLLLDILSKFKNPLIIILLIASGVSFFLGEETDAIIIIIMVFFSVLLDFFQEYKAERAAEALKARIATKATVLRDGTEQIVDFSSIVPGDILKLSAGDVIPADARVLAANDLLVDQSSLTGESFPVLKTSAPIGNEDTHSIGTWSNYLFMGTGVITGSATAVVVKTGSATEYGEIVKKTLAERPPTEFETGLHKFGMLITKVIVVLVAFVFITQTLFKNPWLESLLFAIALAVGLTPELLPMILSINLTRGAVSMSKKGVIVKRLSSIENFGAMDVLCSDKTGTLSENRIVLFKHVDIDGRESERVFEHAYLNSHFQSGLHNLLDNAILSHGNPVMSGKDEKIGEISFDFNRKRVSVVVRHKGSRLLVTKGAPEEVFKACTHYERDGRVVAFGAMLRAKAEAEYRALSTQGFMMLGVAYKRVAPKRSRYTVLDEDGLVFLGFVGFLDPPKESAKESLRLLHESGVELKILTGDNDLVTRKVCEEIGFEIKGVLLGKEIEAMDDAELAQRVETTNVFARVTPSQKNRIMLTLKKNGHVVGFMGDGINDTPSMRVADVSISVDNAVEIAKDSADIILLKQDLHVLKEGVLEGRKTFGNTMKYVMMGLSSNFGNMFSAAVASLFLPFLPMLPIQILLNNLLYDFSQVTIPMDNVDKEYVGRPKKMNIKFVRDFMLFFGPVSSLFDFLTFFVLLVVFGASAALFQTGWFIESLCTQTLIIFAIRTRQPFFRSAPSIALAASMLLIVGIAVAIPYTPVGAYFQFTPPPFSFLMVVFSFVVVYFAMAELMKWWFYKKYPQY